MFAATVSRPGPAERARAHKAQAHNAPRATAQHPQGPDGERTSGLISGRNLKENVMPNAATQSEQMSDPIERVPNRGRRLTEVFDCLRADIGRVEEPQFKAMFETAAEVL